jgi:hypothetical protein
MMKYYQKEVDHEIKVVYLIYITSLFLLTLYSFLFIITEIKFDVHYLHEEIKIK